MGDEIRLHRIECHLPFPLMEGLLKALFKKIRTHALLTTSTSTATIKESYDSIIQTIKNDIFGYTKAGNLHTLYQIEVDYVLGLAVVPTDEIKHLKFINQFFPSNSSAAASSSSSEDTSDRAAGRIQYFRNELRIEPLVKMFDELIGYLRKKRNDREKSIKTLDLTAIKKNKMKSRKLNKYISDTRFSFRINDGQTLFFIEIKDTLTSNSPDLLGVHLTIGSRTDYPYGTAIDKQFTYHITDFESNSKNTHLGFDVKKMKRTHRFFKAMNNVLTGESSTIKSKTSSASAAETSLVSGSSSASAAAAPVSSSLVSAAKPSLVSVSSSSVSAAAAPVSSSSTSAARPSLVSVAVPVSSSSASSAASGSSSSASATFNAKQLLVVKKGETLSNIMRTTGALSIDLSKKRDITDDEFIEAIELGLKNVTNLNMTGCLNISNKSLASLTNLRSLSINECEQITDVGLAPLKNLIFLNMRSCKHITDVGLAHLTNLTSLNISFCNQITDTGLEPLINLNTLNIAYCKGISDKLLIFNRLNLIDLNMSGCTQITDAGLARLTNLTHLKINDCEQITSGIFRDLDSLIECSAKRCASGVEDAAEAKIVSNRTSKGGTRRRRFKKSKKTKKTKKTRRN